MSRRQGLAIFVFVLVLGFVLALLYWLLTPRLQRLAPYADDEYIAQASKTEEARLFLGKYPDATRTVEREAGLVVDLGVARNGHTLDLRILMDAFDNHALESVVYCDRRPEYDIGTYLANETCLGP